MGKRKREILTGVELGTSTIKVLMGEFLEDGTLNIVGFSERSSLKVAKGEVQDANLVREQLILALSDAEKNAGLEIGHVFLGVTGNSVRSINSVGSTAVRTPDQRISENDLVTALTNAKAYGLPPDKRVLHHMDRRYIVDAEREVLNPIGQVGGKLDADIQIIYGQHNTLETSCRIIRDVMGYPATDIAFSGIAAALGVFSSAEMARGSLVIDIGAGVTEYALFYGAGVFHSGQISVGCEHIANDLSIGLRLPVSRCRTILQELKGFDASAMMRPDGRSRIMEVETLARQERSIPLSSVEHIIELRLRELLQLIRRDLHEQEALSRISNTIAVSGGGAMVSGVEELVRDVFQMPARVTGAGQINGRQEVVLSPRFAVPAGLIRWGRMSVDIGDNGPSMKEQVQQDVGRFFSLVKKAFK
ncbi:MAG: cell division protein FtsA [Lentisphaeria bacterium]